MTTQQFTPLSTSDESTYGPQPPEESSIHLVLNLALRIGEVQMASGAGASDVTATILGVTYAYGLSCEVDVIFTSITVSCHRGRRESPITALRTVRGRGSDFTRLAAVEDLVTRITGRGVTAENAVTELDQITSAPRPYPRWVATAAWAGMAASISVLIGGTGLTASIAALITAVIDRIGRRLNRRAMPVFFQQMVGGVLATLASLLVVFTGAFADLQQPALIVAATITVLLSGLSVVGTVQDAITGYNVTAAGRTIETALMSVGLIAGILLALKLGVLLGLDARHGQPRILPNAAPRTSQAVVPHPLPEVWVLLIKVLAGASAAAFFALASYAAKRALLIASAAGAVGVAVYYSLQLVGTEAVISAASAALLIGLGGGVLSRRLGVPPVIVAVSGLTPLLPGLSTYRALYLLIVERNVSSGIGQLMIAIGTALALGAGVVLGEYLGRPVRPDLGRLERKLAGPRMAGPLPDRPVE